MATTKQRRAARRNVKKAQRAARQKRTIAHLPKSVRSDLGRQGAKVRRARRSPGGRSLDEHSRQELYERAKKLNIPGRSKMGKADLIRAIRRHS